MGYIVTGRMGWQVVYLESTPERNHLHGTMGDYGFTPYREKALVFDTESRASWHAARAYPLDGNRGSVERLSKGRG